MTDVQWFIWGVVATLSAEFISIFLLALLGGKQK